MANPSNSAGNLRNIAFSDVKIQVLALDRFPKILIRWELEKTTQNLKNLKFIIHRGESPEELKPISQEISHNSLYEYVDTDPAMRVNHKNYFYRIDAVEYRSNAIVQTFQSEIATWENQIDLVGLYIVEEHEFKYRYIGGQPVMIFKNRRDGAYCCECWDTVLKRPTKSNCQTCHGTGKQEGFFNPITTWMDLNPSPEVVTIAEFGEKGVGQRDGELTNYPLLDSRDIILDVVTNDRWRVESIHPVLNRHQVVIRQLVRLSLINKTDIEYKMCVDEGLRKQLVDEFHEITQEREF